MLGDCSVVSSPSTKLPAAALCMELALFLSADGDKSCAYNENLTVFKCAPNLFSSQTPDGNTVISFSVCAKGRSLTWMAEAKALVPDIITQLGLTKECEMSLVISDTCNAPQYIWSPLCSMRGSPPKVRL
eukprot:gene4247-14360_t